MNQRVKYVVIGDGIYFNKNYLSLYGLEMIKKGNLNMKGKVWI